MTVRLVKNPAMEEKIQDAHRKGAAFFAALLRLESDTPGARFDSARNLEQIANRLLDVAQELKSLAEEEEEFPP